VQHNAKNPVGSETPPVVSRFLLRQIENILYEHSGVDEVAVICTAREEGPDKLMAFIVPRHPGLTEAEILDFLKQSAELDPANLPRAVKFVPRIPKSPSGKVLKLRLLEEVCAQAD